MRAKLDDEQVQIGEGQFVVRMSQEQADLLKTRGLLDNDLLHLLNGLADLLEHDEGLSRAEIYTFVGCLCEFTKRKFALYTYLLDKHGPEGMTKNLWMRFADNVDWPLGTYVFMDMPTAILEELAQDIWNGYMMYDERQFPTEKIKDEVLRSLKRRTDYYGSKSLPPDLAFGLLIEEENRG